jgi:transposase InsO family protein
MEPWGSMRSLRHEGYPAVTTGWRGSCAGLVGCHRRRPVHTTQCDPAATLAPDLVQRSFLAPAPDQLWIADISHIPTEEEGFLYLAVILDVFSRQVVGWSMQEHLRTEMVVAAACDGSLESPSGTGPHAPFGSRLPAYFPALRQPLSGPGDPVFHRIGGRLL